MQNPLHRQRIPSKQRTQTVVMFFQPESWKILTSAGKKRSTISFKLKHTVSQHTKLLTQHCMWNIISPFWFIWLMIIFPLVGIHRPLKFGRRILNFKYSNKVRQEKLQFMEAINKKISYKTIKVNPRLELTCIHCEKYSQNRCISLMWAATH